MKFRVNIGILVFAAIVIVVEILAITKVFRDNRRLSDNFSALAKGTEYYRINDSISAARTERMLLDNAEIKSYFPEIAKTIGQMDVKLRQLERYSAVNSTANYEIATRIYRDLQGLQDIQDSSYQSPVSPMSLSFPAQYTEYHDKWIDFRQAIVADSAYTSIRTRDSIAIVQSWEHPHRLWFLKWGRKRHIQTVTNANPNATVTYSIYVEQQ